ncbi:MAG: hypothetical protein AAFX85_17940 [Pseudomonadota bacterium]
MTVFTMIVWVVAIGGITSLLAKRYEYMQSQSRHDDLDDDLRHRLDHLEELEERVRVLEAIVTDKNYSLRRQLDDLERTG